MISPPLSLDEIPAARIDNVADALILPVAAEKGSASGVFHANEHFCHISRTRISRERFTDIPDYIAPEGLEYLAGRYLYGGIARHHFGHFLLETLSRLWALGQQNGGYDGLILLPMAGTDFAATLRRRMLGFFQLMGCDMPIHLVNAPVVVEKLDVPTQGFGHGDWVVGSEEFRHYVRDRVDQTCPAHGAEKIYISRRKLKHEHQQLDFERRIEKLMKGAGYTILHPQRMSLKAQCQAYRAAHTIVGGDGSAFHLVPFAMQPETRVGLIERRDRPEVVDSIALQIEAFAPVDLVRLTPLAEKEGETDKIVSFRKLKRQLEKAHLI